MNIYLSAAYHRCTSQRETTACCVSFAMRCIVVGGRQAVFDRLSNVEHVANVDELILRLRKKYE